MKLSPVTNGKGEAEAIKEQRADVGDNFEWFILTDRKGRLLLSGDEVMSFCKFKK